MDTPNDTISEAARQAAHTCAGIAYGEYRVSGKDTAPLFEPVIQRAITDATAAQAQRIAELENAIATREMVMEAISETRQEAITELRVANDELKNARAEISRLCSLADERDALRKQVADLQSRVTFAEQRAQDRQEQLTGLRRKAAESEQTCNIYREELERVKGELSEARKRTAPKTLGELEAVNLRSIVSDQDQDISSLRAELASARQQAKTARSEASEDTADLDWLARHVVEVRLPLVHGSRAMFFATPEDDDGYMGPSDLRSKIHAARHAAGTTEGGE